MIYHTKGDWLIGWITQNLIKLLELHTSGERNECEIAADINNLAECSEFQINMMLIEKRGLLMPAWLKKIYNAHRKRMCNTSNLINYLHLLRIRMYESFDRFKSIILLQYQDIFAHTHILIPIFIHREHSLCARVCLNVKRWPLKITGKTKIPLSAILSFQCTGWNSIFFMLEKCTNLMQINGTILLKLIFHETKHLAD